jgi:membrane associated rhomboid family serine protease
MPSSTVPMVGASGAIAGVLGAYLVLYPRANVRCLWVLFVFITTINLPAWALLGGWLVSQFFIPGAGVAWMAHVGGFVFGAAAILLFTGGHRPAPPSIRGRDQRRYIDTYAY